MFRRCEASRISPISCFHLYDYPLFINGLAMTKLAAAEANHSLGLLTDEQFDGISKACLEILDGKHHDQFPVDMIQGGAGTSTNMNANEVIANRALQIMGHEAGEYKYVSPNDHVNCSQSTNDAYPTAIHFGLYATHKRFMTHFEELIAAFERKAEEFAGILKMGRTQLEDAVPMTLGQTFGAYASILRQEIRNIDFAAEELLTVNMGATAIGTGICSRVRVCRALPCRHARDNGLGRASGRRYGRRNVGYDLHGGLFAGIAPYRSQDEQDMQRPASVGFGPRCGLHEFDLPARQPGSSIMPGKVNPVIPEVMNQIAYKVIGNDLCVAMSAEAAQMELNAMEPVMAQCCFESAEIMMNGFDTLRVNCVDGIKANEEQCREYVPQQHRHRDGFEPDHRLQKFDEDRQGGFGNRRQRLRSGLGARCAEQGGAGYHSQTREHDPSRQARYPSRADSAVRARAASVRPIVAKIR